MTIKDRSQDVRFDHFSRVHRCLEDAFERLDVAYCCAKYGNVFFPENIVEAIDKARRLVDEATKSVEEASDKS